jgi:membrane protease YdiL (CAAX protease family)
MPETMIRISAYPQQTLFNSFMLHVWPGVLITVAFVLFKPLSDSIGYPPLFAYLLAILFVGLPMLLGILFFAGKKEGKSVLFYRERIGKRPFVLIFIGSFIVLYLLITLATPVNAFLTETVFSILPDWMVLDEQSQYLAYPRHVLVITFVLQFILTGMLLPWVEELYFRGFLLPRIARYKWLAPIMGGVFFGLYHSWQPYGFFTVFLMGTAFNYLVMWQRDIRLSIGLHVFTNALTRFIFLMVAVAM